MELRLSWLAAATVATASVLLPQELLRRLWQLWLLHDPLVIAPLMPVVVASVSVLG